MDHFRPLAELIGFKGINADFIEEMLPNADNPIYLTDGDSVLIKGGKIEKLPGVDYLNGISAPFGAVGSRDIIGLPIFENYANQKRLLAVTPTRAAYLSSDSVFTDLGLVLAGNRDSVLSFANIDNLCAFVLSDDGTIYAWDGGSASQLVNPATLRARYLMGFQTYLVLARPIVTVGGVETERYNEIWPSYPGDVDHFDEEDRLMITAAGAINGCRQLADTMVIYFPKSIHQVYWISETEGFGNKPIVDSDGLMSPKTLTGDQGSHFYLGKEGVMRLRVGSTPEPLSWSKFNKFIVDGIDPLYYHRAVSRYFPDAGLLYFAFPPAGSSENGTLLIYSVMDGELVGKKALTGRPYSSLGVFEKDLADLTPDERRSYGVGGIPIIGTTDGHVLEQKYSAYTELASTYESSMTLPPMFFGDRHRNKRLMQCDLLVEKQTDVDITFNLEISNEANVTTVTPYVITGTGNQGIRRYVVYLDNVGKEFRTVLKDSANAYGFKLHGLIFRGYFATHK
jgi:hypothetical protein